MREDERLLYEKMVELVQGQDVGLASNAAMNLVAALIVAGSPSLEQAELGAKYVGKQIAEIVKLHWSAQDTGHREPGRA
jgi:hypothetical protein